MSDADSHERSTEVLVAKEDVDEAVNKAAYALLEADADLERAEKA